MGNVAKEAAVDVKEKGKEIYKQVLNQRDLADEIVADGEEETAVDGEVMDEQIEDQVRAAVEDAKKPLE